MSGSTNRPPISMEVFTRSSKVNIGRGSFSNIGRDQFKDCTIHQTIQNRREIDKTLPELSKFTEINHGDIYKDKDVCYIWRLCSNGKWDSDTIATEAAVYHAEINITGSFGQKKFTVKTYHGRNAMKEWRRDFLRCSRDWSGDVPLFGYNKSLVPLLIFHGGLIPLAHIEDRIGYAGCFYIELLRSSMGCTADELWIDPLKGRFCRGPVGPDCRRRYIDYTAITVPLDVEFLEEDVVVRYFSCMEYDRWLLCALSNGSRFERIQDISPGPCRFEVVSGLTQAAIAFTWNVRWWSRTDGCLVDWKEMSNGVRRFRLRLGRRNVELFPDSGELSSWLSQASSVFHLHHISLDADLSEYKFIFPIFRLKGILQRSKRKRQRRQLYEAIYLLVFPSPSPLSEFTQFYSWSFDTTGQHLLTPDMCSYLGLPFKLSLEVNHFYQFSWPAKTYKTIRDYQLARGFDPETTDFAGSLGYSVYEVVPPESRFQPEEQKKEWLSLARDDQGPLVEALPDDPSQRSCDVQTEGLKNTSDVDLADTETSVSPEQDMKYSLLGALSRWFTWEEVENLGISAGDLGAVCRAVEM